ncbi:zinc finger CCCH domain-containing protein 13 isoform X2 [Culicoides brevitarsis]
MKLTILPFGILLGFTVASPHSTPYSLQAAVDALHRRESQLSNNRESPFEDNEGTNRRALNHLLANYLGRDEMDPRYDERDIGEEYLPEFDDREQFLDDLEEYGDRKRKRSMFREREEQQPSVFREREYGHPSTMDEDFLREMDRERNLDRDRKYHALIKQLWGKYKHDDEELERQLLRNELEHTRDMQDDENYPDMEEMDDYYKKKRAMKKKRMMFAPMIAAGYYGGAPGGAMSKKKRDYPMLPWLPASRKKRFPVAKRSPPAGEFHDTMNTDEKVTHELKEIFGDAGEEEKKKKKRADDLFGMDKKSEEPKKSDELEEEKKKKAVKKSGEAENDEEEKKKRAMKKSEVKAEPEEDKKKKKSVDLEEDKKKKRAKKDRFIDDDFEKRGDKMKKRSIKRKRNSDCSDDEYCDEPHDHYHDSEEDSSEDENDDEEEDDDTEDSDDDRRRKKKRDVKKHKRSNAEIFREDQVIPGDLMDMKKRSDTPNTWSRIWGMDRKKKSTGSSSRDYPLSFYKNYEEDRRRNLDVSKIENMDAKLKAIEDLLIDETIKYTGAHEGNVEPEDVKELKDHVVSRLATAYNLEKMRHALDKIKNNMEQEQHLEANEIPVDESDDDKKAKRVAVKKEKVEFDHSAHKPEDAPKKVTHEEPDNEMSPDDEDKKKKKKKKRNGIDDLLEEGEFEQNLSDQCMILDNLEKRCKGVDALSGDLHQDLLPACGVHQLCYLCGSTQSECDFQYLADAEAICGHHPGCQSAARSALMILRGFPSPTLGPRECAKNPCLYQALKDIGV